MLTILGAAGGGIVLLLLVVIVVSSVGGDDPDQGDQARLTAPPEPVRFEIDPWYEANRWFRYDDRGGRFFMWVPEQPESVDYQPANQGSAVSLSSTLGSISFRQSRPSETSNPRKSIERERRELATADRRQPTRLSEKWGEYNGMTFLDTVSSIRTGTGPEVFEYERLYAGNGWIASISVMNVTQDAFQQESHVKFMQGFQTLINAAGQPTGQVAGNASVELQ